MKKVRLLGLLVFLLFIFPMPGSPGADIKSKPSMGGDQVSNPYALSGNGGIITGTGDPLSYSMAGEATNYLDGTFVIDSSTNELATVTISDGWTGSDLSTTIDTLSMDVDDVRNGDMNLYHNEKFLTGTGWNDVDVAVPNFWTLTKSITGSGDTHPMHGTFELNDVSGAGYSSTIGWRFDADWGAGATVNTDDQIYLSQQVLAPYRELYSAELSFNYYVLGASSLVDQVFIVTRVAGYESEFHVFESGDTTGTWLSASVTIPGSYLTTITLPNSLLLEIGLESNVDGSQSLARTSEVYIDNIGLSLNVRPFPEQIDLKVNGTAVVGATPGSVYPYLPDDSDRDAEDNSANGLDLDGWPWGAGSPGILYTGVWGTSDWTDADPYQTGYQFPLDIPQGAVITSAYLEVEPASETALAHMRIYAAGQNSSGLPIENFTTGLPHLEDRFNWVDTSIDWTVTDFMGLVRIRQRSPDIAPLIQSIVSDSNWMRGNYTAFMLDFMWGSSYQAEWGIKGSDGTNSYAQDELARLFVEYMIPLPEDTAYFMQYEKDITIQSSQVVADQTDFPVLIDIYDTDLKTDVQSDGDDIVFRLGDDALDFEIESFDQSYSPTEAHLTAWVKIPYLSSTVDTVITMTYGNPNALSSSSTAVWDDYATIQHLNDDPSGTIYDSTSNNHDGTAYGTMGSEDSVSGLISGGIDFDGVATRDMISIGQIYTDDWSEVTISIWVKSDLADDTRPFSKSPSTGPSEHIVTIRTDGANRMTARMRTDFGGTSVNSNTTFNQGSWNLMTWSWSASSGYILGYINGTPVIQTARSGNNLYDSIDVFVIGNTDLTNERCFDGILDEARLANRVLSQTWIATEFNNQIDPSSFVSVGSERTLQSTWIDESSAQIIVSTGSAAPITTDVIFTMEISASGQSLDENMNTGTTFYASNGSEAIDWVANVLVSPPASTSNLDVDIEYPYLQWGPVAVSNPLGQNKTYGTEWDVQGGTLTVYGGAFDYWGVWTVYFQSWNYIESLQLGIQGQTLGNTATFDVNDIAEFNVTSPWMESGLVGLSLTDPSGSVWYSDSQTTGSPGSLWHVPSFQYRMPLTVPATEVTTDVDMFPLLVSFAEPGIFPSKVQTDGDDFVFVQNDLVVPHEIDRYDSGTGRLVAWVRMNLSSTVDNDFLVYYGNPYVGSTEDPYGVWSNNYEAVWHLNEGNSEPTHRDSTIGNYTGIKNGNTLTSGIDSSYAQQFDGSDWIEVNSSRGLNPVGDVTISGWFRLDAAFTGASSPSMVLVEKYLNPDIQFYIALAGADYLEAGVPKGALTAGFEQGGEHTTYTSTVTWASNTWYHFVFYMDADTTSNNAIYINGLLNTGGQVGTQSPLNLSYSTHWGLGGRYVDTSEFPTGEAFLTGRMEEVRITAGSRTAGWIASEYNNTVRQSQFIQRSSEESKVSAVHTFTKTIDSSADAGLWTATVYYNDTGSSVTNKTGIYERNFIVQHDTTLTLNYPTDAVGDKIAYATAGDPIYIEYELTDDITLGSLPGATVKMNWTVSGTPSEVTLDNLGDGRYSTTLDTDDLQVNKNWRINIWSYHPYYNNATDYFDLELYHKTNLTYVNVENTPYGFDFKATLVFRDSYSNSPITGATITFENGTGVSYVDIGNGQYDISMSSSSYDFGVHWFRFKANKAGTYLEDAIVNVTFTVRKHYTTVSVQGDLNTPSGFTTDLTVVIIDTDTGTILSGTSSISSWTFNPASYSDTTETPPGDFAVTLDTSGWSIATESVTLSVTMNGNYYNPANYQFDIVIRKHYTAVGVTGDFLTPYGQTTGLTVIITDLDTGAELGTTASVSSWTFNPASYSDTTETPPGDFAVTLDTSSWSVGTDTVTLSVTMSGIYNNPTNFQFDIEIRRHYTSVTVTGDFLTPYGMSTLLTVIITDLDTGTALGTTSSVSSWTFNPASYGDTTETPPGDFSVDLDTSTWSVGTDTVTLSVTMSGIYYSPSNYQFDIQIRNHRTAVSVLGGFDTPYGQTTPVAVVITDLDLGSALASTASVSSWSFTSGYSPVTETPPADFDVALTTAAWAIGVETVTLSVTMSGTYDNPSNIQFDVTIRKHYTSVTVIGDLITPSGYTTSLTVVLTDSDTGTVLSGTGSISSWTFNPASYSDTTETPPGDFAVTLDTSGWSVGTDTVTLSVTMTGIYENPSNYQFDIEIRKHYTAVSVSGGLVSPYGNTTDITVIITDLDTNTVLASTASITSWSFTSSYSPVTETPPSDFAVTLTTSTWAVGSETVTLAVTMSGIYNNPSNYQFDVTIRGITTVLYNEPSDLLFPTGDDFNIVLQVNVSESGTYYGDPVTGLLQAEFSVRNSTFTYPITINEMGNGRYNLTIAAQYFPEGDYTIFATVNPSSSTYQGSQLIITFFVRPARSDLTSNLYTISTPYNTDGNVTLTYKDLDRNQGITTGTITANSTIAFVHLGNGIYEVAIDVSGFSLGSQVVNLTADAAGFDARSVMITIIVTQIHTDAEPSVISLDMPVGYTKIFYISYTDLDNSLDISGASVANNWTGSVALDIAWSPSDSAYKVNFTTTGTDTLGTYIVWFNFTNGANYQPGYCEIEITIRTHITIFNLVSAVEPTAFNGIINISLRYYDFDSKAGIDSANIDDFVWNGTDWISTTLINDGGGFYTIRIDASQFGLGIQAFDVYFNWTGPVQQYENKTVVATVNIIGVDSELALLASSEPTPYLGNMSYTIFYSEVSSGLGITNTSNPYGDGNVHIYVTFSDGSVDTSEVNIWEVDYVSNAGEFTIQFNTTIFGYTGLIYMSVFINWTDGVQPYYTNRLDTISVRVLPRTTSVAVIPANPTAWGEEVSFSFTYEDVTGASSVPIANDTALSIGLNVTGYSVAYDGVQRIFTITFNTSEFASIGQKALSLNVTWNGAPFYANQTARIIQVRVTTRQTLMDYQSPPPTPYLDNATFSIIWTDIAGTVYGIDGATVTLYDGASPISTSYYTVTPLGSGEYEIEFASTYYTEPGFYTLTASLSTSLFYIDDVSSDRTFNVRYRTTLLSAEPLDTIPFNSTIELTLYYQDILTLANIGNGTGDVSITILNGSSWYFSSQWIAIDGNYLVSVQTYNQAGLEIGQTYSLGLRFNYTYQSPYYRYDDLTVYFELRFRASSLEKSKSPVQTPYLDYVNFSVYFSDADESIGIVGASIYVLESGNPLTLGTEYLYSALGNGYYTLSVDSTALPGLGANTVSVWANWTSGSPYHENATFDLDLVVIHRSTDVVYVISPSQTSFLENVTFVVSFQDLALGQLITATKSLVSVYNGGTQLLSSEFTFVELGSTKTYEISINSTILSSILANDLNITVTIDWPESPNYYQDDASSTRATIRARDSFLSVERPANTAYGENATLTLTFVDTTNVPEELIANSAALTLITNLIETPTVAYDSGTREFTISFDTAQFGSDGQFTFHINVTWAGSPFYTNQTLHDVTVTVVLRQTQVDFQAPAPTPYGDSVTFYIWYLDIAGASDTGIPDGSLTMYYAGVPIAAPNVTITNIGDGSFRVVLDTDFFSAPGTYSLNASFVYTGSEYAADASAIRPISVRYRTTVLSSDPVGTIPYNTTMQITLYYQDQLTLTNIGSSTTFEILNDTGTPWDYTITWNGALSLYELSIETNGQPFSVGQTYFLHLNMSYAYQVPFYRWDDLYVQFSVRGRISTLDISEGAQPASYFEYATFVVYYWDVDESIGIGTSTTFTIENETHTLAVSDYSVTPGLPGYYTISVNTSSLSTLGFHALRITAVWGGGAPYYNNAQRNITVSVIQRTTSVEIISPPSSTPYLDNVTFTFSYTDTISNSPILAITSNDIVIYSNGTLLNPGEFSLKQLGAIFEIEINSTFLKTELVTSYNITIIIDWDIGTAPYYRDAVTALRVSTISRTLFVEVGTIDTTPYGDNVTINFFVNDDASGVPVSNAIVLFSCHTQPITGLYTVYEGPGAGQYTISLLSAALVVTENDFGDFTFDLEVHWDPAVEPYYKNRTAIELTASVDAIWAVGQSGAPQPSSVQITDNVTIVVTYSDFDHGIPVDNSSFLTTILVTYDTAPYTGIIPSGLIINQTAVGEYTISFNTVDIDSLGTVTLNITLDARYHTTSKIYPQFSVERINTGLIPKETEILLNWTEIAEIVVYYENQLNGSGISGAILNWTYGGDTGTFTETSPGNYTAYVPTFLADSGTRIVFVEAIADKYKPGYASITLIALALPSDMDVQHPDDVFEHPRGNPIDIIIYLEDTYNVALINLTYVEEVYVTFDSIRYDLNYYATNNSWFFTLPGSATSSLTPGITYSARISAKIRNYNPVSAVFKIDLQATSTFLENYGDTTDKMEVYYSDLIDFELNFTDVDGIPIDLARVYWPNPKGDYNFTNVGGGIWQLTLNSSALERWGTFGMTFSGVPVDTNYAETTKSIAVTVKQIPTESPGVHSLTVYWGWSGNVTFTYYDEWFERGIDNSSGLVNIITEFASSTILYDLHNGSYSIFFDTRNLAISHYFLGISFDLENYVTASNGVDIFVEEVPTDLVLTTPELNWISEDADELQVPFEENVEIRLFYNDTDLSDGYIGGLSGAIDSSFITGGLITIPVQIHLDDLGNGTYVFLFQSTEPSLFPDTIPGSLEGFPYFITIQLELEQRETRTIRISIRIIDRPTQFSVISDFVVDSGASGIMTMFYGDQIDFVFAYTEAWLPYLGQGIDGATILVSYGEQVLVNRYNGTAGTTSGWYKITFSVDAPLLPFTISSEQVSVDISVILENHVQANYELTINILPTDSQTLTSNILQIGTPSLFLILLLGFLWVRIFSVPKRLRQINGQIKALRKGKTPKPIDGVKSRQQLVADLYNDTNKELSISRDASMMPVESIPVEVPEMGEILIQLSILTHLSPDELDEFKADISKMKMSEQAAFVKEVINQEAIRAARRDGKTVDQVLEDVEAEARARLRGEEEKKIISEVKPEERILLIDEEPETTPDLVISDETVEEKVDIAKEIRTEEAPSIAEKLSDYEIEELRKELQEKGVEPHEIETILEQARELPRDLVDELLKSLDMNRE